MKIMFLCSFALLCSMHNIHAMPSLEPHTNLLTNLTRFSIWNPHTPLRLHLGCGESYLEGYINIDFPSEQHTVQTRQTADVFADITTLCLPAQTVDEIRSHHVFEHFNRQIALALLCSWQHGLKNGGILVIETPDFEASIRVFLNPSYTYKQKQVSIRHIFGSHEASWAMHYDGWYKEKFIHILQTLGFKILATQPGGSTLIPNITIRAQKEQHYQFDVLQQKAKNLLRLHMVNTSASEEEMWQVWCKDFEKHLTKIFC